MNTKSNKKFHHIDNPHRRGMIGEIVANDLIDRGWWYEYEVNRWGETVELWTKLLDDGTFSEEQFTTLEGARYHERGDVL